MNASRSAFQILKPPCVRLSEVSARLRSGQSNFDDVATATTEVLRALQSVQSLSLPFDSKLAEYAFFPLSNLFFERQRLPVRVLESALKCLNIILATGWRLGLDKDLALQLLMLLTFLASSGVSEGVSTSPASSEEVQRHAFGGQKLVCEALRRSPEALAQLTDQANLPALAKAILLAAETSRDSWAVDVQLSALSALRSLLHCINDRGILANFFPGVVSVLTQLLTPGTKQSKHYKVLAEALSVLSQIISLVMADEKIYPLPLSKRDGMGESWLSATSAQVKMGLANVFRLHLHSRIEVLSALAELCLMLLRTCQHSLIDSMEPTVETLLLQSDRDPDRQLLSRMGPIVADSTELGEILKSCVYRWLHQLPITMLSNDDSKRRSSLQRLLAGLQLLLMLHVDLTFVTSSLQSIFREIIETQLGAQRKRTKTLAPRVKMSVASDESGLITRDNLQHVTFPLVLDVSWSFQEDMAFISQILHEISDTTDIAGIVSESLDHARSLDDDARLASLWIALDILKSQGGIQKAQTDFFNIDVADVPNAAYEDLYALALNLLNQEDKAAGAVLQSQALALEAVAMEAVRLGTGFRPELVDSLYPVVHFLGASDAALRSHAAVALDSIAHSTAYGSVKEMIVSNADYLVNALSAKLNAYDLEPQVPTVLKMLVKLTGPAIVPYLDDLVDSAFDALDKFHGYPELVGHVFSALTATVEECASGKAFVRPYVEAPSHQKRGINPAHINTTVDWLRAVREKAKQTDSATSFPKKTPHESWTNLTNEKAEPDSIPAPDKEKEAPLTPSYKTALKIARHAISHVTSPSAGTRASLLYLLSIAIPFLAKHDDNFLPLVNDVWPSLLYRLRDEEHYVVCASIEVMTAMVRGAGDFMASRIQGSWHEFRRLWALATPVMPDSCAAVDGTTTPKASSGVSSRDLASIMSSPTQHGRSEERQGTLSVSSTHRNSSREHTAYTPTTKLRLHSSLVSFLTTTMTHTRLSEEIANEIELWVMPMVLADMRDSKLSHDLILASQGMQLTDRALNPDSHGVVKALASRNPDAVWLTRELRHCKNSAKRRQQWQAALPKHVEGAPEFCEMMFI